MNGRNYRCLYFLSLLADMVLMCLNANDRVISLLHGVSSLGVAKEDIMFTCSRKMLTKWNTAMIAKQNK